LIIVLPATLVPRPVDCGAISYERGTFVPVAVCHRTGGANAFDNFTITKIGSGQLFISALFWWTDESVLRISNGVVKLWDIRISGATELLVFLAVNDALLFFKRWEFFKTLRIQVFAWISVCTVTRVGIAIKRAGIWRTLRVSFRPEARHLLPSPGSFEIE